MTSINRPQHYLLILTIFFRMFRIRIQDSIRGWHIHWKQVWCWHRCTGLHYLVWGKRSIKRNWARKQRTKWLWKGTVSLVQSLHSFASLHITVCNKKLHICPTRQKPTSQDLSPSLPFSPSWLSHSKELSMKVSKRYS